MVPACHHSILSFFCERIARTVGAFSHDATRTMLVHILLYCFPTPVHTSFVKGDRVLEICFCIWDEILTPPPSPNTTTPRAMELRILKGNHAKGRCKDRTGFMCSGAYCSRGSTSKPAQWHKCVGTQSSLACVLHHVFRVDCSPLQCIVCETWIRS